ncbi:MAG: lipid-A-disaccharide synthase [Pyrinomonadaceae bacterium]
MPDTKKIMIVAGEASGDERAAELVRALQGRSPDIKFDFFGATGAKMREAGVETVFNADELAVVGLPEIARALPMFRRTFKTLKRAAVERKPDVVVLVDFPDFNMKLAKSLKKSGFKIVYYISPQLWAWREYRKKTIKKYVDLLLAILPFEKEWYLKQGISHVEYVGNPLAGKVEANFSRREFCGKYNLEFSKPIAAFLPGSRYKEIVRILPEMLKTISRMFRENADLQFSIALASDRRLAEVKSFIEDAVRKNLRLPENILIACGETKEALNAANVAAVTSGTATLETAIIGTPMVIVYKTSALNYGLLRPLISVPHFGLINLIAEKRLAVELIQSDFTSENLSRELFRLLEPENNRAMREELSNVVETLGRGGASERAADAILSFLEKQN